MESEQLHMISPTTLFVENPETYIPEILLKHLAFHFTEEQDIIEQRQANGIFVALRDLSGTYNNKITVTRRCNHNNSLDYSM